VFDTDFEDDCKDIVQRRKKLTQELKKTAGTPAEQKFFALEQNVTEEEHVGLTTSAQKRKKPKRRVTKWQRGYTPRPKRVNTSTRMEKDGQTLEVNGIDKDLDGVGSGEDEQVVENNSADDMCNSIVEDEDSRTSGGFDMQQSSTQSVRDLETSHIFTIDENQLIQLEKDLVECTENYSMEPLERLFCQLTECVRPFKLKYDRSSLIEIIRSMLPSNSQQKALSNSYSTPQRQHGGLPPSPTSRSRSGRL
jgi:hypothetical protein